MRIEDWVSILNVIVLGIGFVWRIAQIKEAINNNIKKAQDNVEKQIATIKQDILRNETRIALDAESLENFKKLTEVQLSTLQTQITSANGDMEKQIKAIRTVIDKELTFRKQKE